MDDVSLFERLAQTGDSEVGKAFDSPIANQLCMVKAIRRCRTWPKQRARGE